MEKTDESLVAIWWLNSHSDCAEIRSLSENVVLLPDYIFSEVISLHGRPPRGRLWSPDEINIDDLTWDDSKPRAAECAERGGIVIWRKDLHYLKDLPGFVTDTQLNEIEV